MGWIVLVHEGWSEDEEDKIFVSDADSTKNYPKSLDWVAFSIMPALTLGPVLNLRRFPTGATIFVTMASLP